MRAFDFIKTIIGSSPRFSGVHQFGQIWLSDFDILAAHNGTARQLCGRYDVFVVLKLRYLIDLTRPVRTVASDGHAVRSITPGDLRGLARLMLDAYVGTIDYDGEDLDDAVREVRSFYDDGHPLLERSYLVEFDGAIVSAVLVSLSEGTPFIGYVMTAPSHKNLGLGRLVTTASLVALIQDGHESVVCYITEGNLPSEALFGALGALHTPAD